MTDYTIGESYTLPSGGKVYKKSVNPDIKLRSMTTEEEMKRLASSDRPYKNMSEIIDDCLIENPGISSYDMCIGDYQFLLHKLRVVTHGKDYKVSCVCPYCSSGDLFTVNLDDFPISDFDIEEYNNLFEFDLPKTQKHIKVKMQTPRIIDDVSVRSKELRRKSPKMSGDPAFLFTVESLIDEVDGEKLDSVTLSNFVRKLPMMDTNVIIKHCDKIVGMVGMDTTLHNVCPVCGLQYDAPFRVTREFYGPDIDI